MIYLDHAASTFLDTEIFDAYKKAMFDYYANPSSPHALGHRSSRILEELDKKTLKLLGLNSGFEVLHVSGATEANNLAIIGYALRNKRRGDELWYLPSEHPSTVNAIRHLEEKEGFKTVCGKLNKDGIIDLEELRNSLNQNTLLVSVSLVNSEVGFINNIKELVKIVRQNSKALIHVDLVQGFGHVDLFDLYSVDFLTLSLHKLNGPKTHGLLIKQKKTLLEPLFFGGGQQGNMRSGTEDLASAVAMYKAMQIAIEKQKENKDNAALLQQYLFELFESNRNVEVNSNQLCSPYIFNFSLLHHKGSVIIEALSNKEIYVSSTSACSSRTNSSSKTLDLLGKSRQISENSVRLSFSYDTSIKEIDMFYKVFSQILKEVKANG